MSSGAPSFSGPVLPISQVIFKWVRIPYCPLLWGDPRMSSLAKTHSVSFYPYAASTAKKIHRTTKKGHVLRFLHLLRAWLWVMCQLSFFFLISSFHANIDDIDSPCSSTRIERSVTKNQLSYVIILPLNILNILNIVVIIIVIPNHYSVVLFPITIHQQPLLNSHHPFPYPQYIG